MLLPGNCAQSGWNVLAISMITKGEHYREILTVLARHGIGLVDDEFVKHEAGDQARAEHLRRACEELGTMFIKLGRVHRVLTSRVCMPRLPMGRAGTALKESEAIGRRHGVQGTPAWFVDGRLLVGLRSAAEFESFAERAMSR